MFSKRAVAVLVAVVLQLSCIQAMPAEMYPVDQADNGILESIGTVTKDDSKNASGVLTSNSLPPEIKMTVINVNDKSDLENAIDNIVKPYNLQYDINRIPLSSWDELQQLMARKNTELNTNSPKTRTEDWFSPSDGSLDFSKDINVPDSLMALLHQEQPPVENNVIDESTNGLLLPINDVQDQETSYETTSKLPVSPAKFIADDDLKLAVKDAIKSALSEVINKLFVDIARDFLRRNEENKLVLKSESVSV